MKSFGPRGATMLFKNLIQAFVPLPLLCSPLSSGSPFFSPDNEQTQKLNEEKHGDCYVLLLSYRSVPFFFFFFFPQTDTVSQIWQETTTASPQSLHYPNLPIHTFPLLNRFKRRLRHNARTRRRRGRDSKKRGGEIRCSEHWNLRVQIVWVQVRRVRG